MSMKVKVIISQNNTVRNITAAIEEWISSESPSEIVSLTQSSCYDTNRRDHIVTITILYKEKQPQQ